MKPADRFCIRLLGGFEVVRDDGTSYPIRLSTKKVCALIAFLAMSRKQSATREELATLLWGNCPDQQARQSLRQALVLLRKDLGSPDVLVADKDVIRLQPGIWSVDALEFEASADSADFAGLECVVALFGGEFLAGFTLEEEAFDEWLRAQRNRVHLAAGRLLATYAERADGAGESQQALAAVERLIALDPLREDWHRLALKLYARHRCSHEALARAKGFEALLRRELDVDPELETTALVEAIRSGAIARIATNAGQRPPSRPPRAVGPRSESRRRWSSRGLAIGTAVVALVMLGGILRFIDRTPGQVRVDSVSDQRRAEAATPAQNASQEALRQDPWQSPRPSTRSAGASVGRERGLVAIAVLPFTNRPEPGEPSGLIADVMTDDITNMLSRVPGFRVISRQTSNSYRGQRVDAATLGAELGIRYVLEGEVSTRGDSLTVNAELIDTRSRLRVWSARFDRTGADRLAIEDGIVNSLGRELEIEVIRTEGERGSKYPGAHELVYRGYAAMFDSATSGLPDLRRAETYFTRALEHDPENPRALTGLGGYHAVMALRLLAPDPVPYLAKAEALLQRVIDRDPNTSQAHQFMGFVHITRGHAADAARSFERAIELNSSCAPCYGHLGRALLRMGRPVEGLEHLHYAMRLSPRDPSMPNWLAMAGSAELELTHYGKAIEYLDRALTFDPAQPRIVLVLVGAHALAGNIGEVRARLAQLQKAQPHLTGEQLVARFFGNSPGGPQLREGLRLALASTSEAPPTPPRPSVANPKGTGKDTTSIAVLPFLTYGDAAGSMQSAADTITDDLTNTLSRVPGLRVISRQTMQSYRGRPVDIAVIGAELGVRYILEGSLRMHGDKLRVNVELTDPTTRLPAWSARIERDRGEQQAVRDEIVGRLGRELQFEIPLVESARTSADPDVRELNVKGWAAIYASGSSVETLRQAETYFTQAVARDPKSKSARTGLGTYHAMAGILWLDADTDGHLAKAQEILQQVIRESPNGSGPYFSLGLVHEVRGELEEAIELYRRALEFNPSNAPAYANLGHALLATGRTREGLDHIRYALWLSPRDVQRSHWLRFVGEAELELGHREEAITYLHQSDALAPRQPITLRSLVAALGASGRLDEARMYLSELRAVKPHLSEERLLERPMKMASAQPELLRGLRLAFALPAAH
jgi:TolB-like protein/DNA-binding SARP family transcriptional activator/Tfp pilus assembly protein PilF